jgi:hypothetical protein
MNNWLCFGELLALLAAATLSLSVADIILTIQYYCINGGEGPYCPMTNDKEPYWPIWVASGIWGSAPVFLTGLLAICSGEDHIKQRWLSFFVLISAIVFTPAIVILTSVEIWRGSASKYSLYSLGSGGVQPGIITPASNPYVAKFALPLVVVILGGIMHLMTFWVMCCQCFCSPAGAPAAEVQVIQPQVIKQEIYQAPRPQIVAPPPCDPCIRYAPPILPPPPPPCDPCSRYPVSPYPPVRYGFNPYGGSRGYY